MYHDADTNIIPTNSQEKKRKKKKTTNYTISN